MSNGQSDEKTFVDRLEALIPDLRAFARNLCHDAELADDLVQDACLKAWSAADTFDESQPMRPWVFRILRNEYYMLTRRSWRSVNVEPEFVEFALVDPGNQETLAAFGRMQLMITALPQAQRDALILVLAAGMTYEEAGVVCGCSAGTIKSRVSRAREAVVARFRSHATNANDAKALTKFGMHDVIEHIDALAGPWRNVA